MTDTITLPRSVVEQALEALKIGHQSAQDCAETFHVEMAGYKQQRHEALDAEVKQISDAIGALRAALEQPQVEQQTRYLAGGARYKVTHLAFAGYCIHGLPREMLGQWVAFVDATDNKHMDSRQPQSVTDCHQSQPQGGQEPVAYYVERHAPGMRDHSTKLGPFWKREDAEGWLDEHHQMHALYTHPQPKREPLTGEQQIAKTLCLHGLALVKTANGYDVLKLGQITAHKIGGDA